MSQEKLILELLLQSNMNKLTLKAPEIRSLLKLKVQSNKNLLWFLKKNKLINSLGQKKQYQYFITEKGISYLALGVK